MKKIGLGIAILLFAIIISLCSLGMGPRYRNWDCRIDFFNHRIYGTQVK